MDSDRAWKLRVRTTLSLQGIHTREAHGLWDQLSKRHHRDNLQVVNQGSFTQ